VTDATPGDRKTTSPTPGDGKTTAAAPEDGKTTARAPERGTGTAIAPGEPLVEVRGLQKYFPITRGIVFQRQIGAVKAVDDISFDILRGETLGIVGETGCGKSTTARLLVRLLDPTGGEVRFEGEDIAKHKGGQLKDLHREMQMIFQDPYSSLNPRKTVGSIIADPYAIHGMYSGEGARKKRVQDLMDRVGLNPEHYNRYPHEFSGGQRQRIGVARAIALEPKLLIADEPVSALDVSIQAQVLNLLRELQREMGLTLVFIAHDLSVVRHMCDRVAVMYLGKIVEIGAGRDLYGFPRHPYTGALMSAVPVPDPVAGKRERQLLSGDVPSPANPPSACRFHTRCPKAQEICSTDEPMLEQKNGGGTRVACHFPLTEAEVKLRLPAALTSQSPASSSPSPSASSST
jgi:oligopeptide/dipeptide ABC transporter ATP-binding protein